ncbi:MAG: Ig-like domain-containing protein [Bacteroidales bacterium]|nr:Ig-like domain-containing protein [Bacteroidales bacterium]
MPLTVAYTKPATNPLQTSAGGQAASLTAQNVTNNVGAPENLPPVINISSPTKSTAFISPATITIDAVAYDPDGIVIKVEFYNGTVKLGEIMTAPYIYTWKDVTEGSYII